ncbi:MAG: NAD(P)-dependent oxidoreductase [Chloroflexi bacterium]|nr:NAD(P)-dependent oxidoreductase [Chloroflexota bacterium]
MKKIGFIGLGIMGEPMAKRLIKAGNELTVCGHRRKEPVEALKAAGAAAVATAREVAARSDVIITMVRDEAQTDEVTFGKDGIFEGLKPGATIILMSTLQPAFCRRLAARVAEKKGNVLDAPVSGAHMRAEAGTLSIFIGGDEKIAKENWPVFEAMGQNLFYQGDLGKGQVVKLINNLVLLLNMQAAAEGVSLGKKAGVDPERIVAILKTSTGNSWVAQNWDHIRDDVILEHRQHGFDGHTQLLYHELGLALEMAKDLKTRLPLSGLASQNNLGGYDI